MELHSSPPLPAASCPSGQAALHSLSPLLHCVCSADRSLLLSQLPPHGRPLSSLWALPSAFHSATRAIFLRGNSDNANPQLPALHWSLPEQNLPSISPFKALPGLMSKQSFPTGLASFPPVFYFLYPFALQSHGLIFHSHAVGSAFPLCSCAQGSATSPFKSYSSSNPIKTVPPTQSLYCMEVRSPSPPTSSWPQSLCSTF